MYSGRDMIIVQSGMAPSSRENASGLMAATTP